MSIFSRVKKEIVSNAKVVSEGGYNSIPWLSLPKFNSVVPGIMQKSYILTTASSKVGKTQITDFLYVLEPYKFIKSPLNTKRKIKLKIFCFLLEMSKEEKILTYLSHYLYQNNDLRYSPLELQSMFKGKPLEQSVIDLIDKEYTGYFDEFEDVVTIHTDIKNPYGIYKEMARYAYANGSYVDHKGYKIPLADIKKGDPDVLRNISHYQPNDPDEYVICITDHLKLLQMEKGRHSNLTECIDDFSSNRCLDLKTKFGYTVVNVQQQMGTQEQKQFDFRGNSIIEKLKPSTDGLADSKKTQQDVDMLISLFAPSRYGMPKYQDYDLTKLKDNYRELAILLNRKGGGLQSVDLMFDGAVNYFKELPRADQLTNAHYNKIMENKF